MMSLKHLCFLTTVSIFFFQCTPASESSSQKEAETDPEVTSRQAPLEEQEVTPLKIGEQAPEFTLQGVDGNMHSLEDYEEAKVLGVVFTCNHCPTAQAYEERLKNLVEDYGDRGFQLVAISPNNPDALLLEELGYSDLGDTYEDMQVRAELANYNFPYLYDGDTHSSSLKYGPQATPHLFLFDQDRRLQYRGRLDDAEKPGTGNAEDARAAIEALLAGEEVENKTTKTFGCSIKWAWKNEFRERVNKEWSEKEVTLEPITTEALSQILANDSDKLRLINVWATWCGPCRIEYPEFVDIHRMYKGRDFEFISLSADVPEKQEDALDFLKEQESAVKNYIFADDNQEQYMEVIDPNWEGSLPYTLLVAPGGKVLYRKQGTINPLKLKQMIVESEYLGRYY